MERIHYQVKLHLQSASYFLWTYELIVTAFLSHKTSSQNLDNADKNCLNFTNIEGAVGGYCNSAKDTHHSFEVAPRYHGPTSVSP